MLSYCKSSKDTSTEIVLNYSALDIDSIELDEIYPTLDKLTKLAVNHIICNYKQFSYLINKKIELSLVVTNNFNIALVNFKWRHLRQSTNVLSMSLISPKDAKISPLVLLGDIVISIEKTIEEANLLSISYKTHLIRLLTHGIVHIFGFDHQSEHEALVMKNIEDTILKLFNKNITPLTNNYWKSSEK